MESMLQWTLVAFQHLSRGWLVEHVFLNSLVWWNLAFIVYHSPYYGYNLLFFDWLMTWELIFLPWALIDFLELHISIFYIDYRLFHKWAGVTGVSPSLGERPEVSATHHVELGRASPLHRARSTNILVCGHVAHPTLLKLPFARLLLKLTEREAVAFIYHDVLHHLLVWVFIFLLLNSL